MGQSSEWSGRSSADHRATVLLRQEHQALLDLFRRQREPTEPVATREALQAAIVDLLAQIRDAERNVLFPALPSEYEAVVQAFLVDQQMLEQCLANLHRATNVARAVQPRNPHVRLEGNADDRGSREYNLALGQRRAEAVRQAMVLSGVRADALEAISYGEERPRCTDQVEDCRATNRRVDILVAP
jgi:outer membrane protein OmpA-like peptidoglycan-associated protein